MGLQTLYSEGPGELASDNGTLVPTGSGDRFPDEPECVVLHCSSSRLVEADDDGTNVECASCCGCWVGVGGEASLITADGDGDDDDEHPSCDPRD